MPPGLRRSRTKRLVSGVCGGLSDRFEIDVTIVRVAFVVVACLWGLGVVLYLALWALVPLAGGDPPDDGPGGEGLPEAATGAPTWLAYVLLAGALFLGLMISHHLVGRPPLGRGSRASAGSWSCSAWSWWRSTGRPDGPRSAGCS